MNISEVILKKEVEDRRRYRISKVIRLFRIQSVIENILIIEKQFKRVRIKEKQRRLLI